MIRQRVNVRRGTGQLLVRLLTIVFAVALIYGGVMAVLLSLKLAPSLGPDKINRLTDYRTVYHWLAGLHSSNFTTLISLIAGFTGLLVFLFFAALMLGSLPRPYLTRTEVGLPDAGRGATLIRPRAVERLAEIAAQSNEHVIGVTGRLGEGALYVDVGVDTAPEAAQTLADVRRRVSEQLARHDLPPMPVSVTLTGYERPTRREPL